jgi:glycosyltransferase involved in cell wall biosynthesis
VLGINPSLLIFERGLPFKKLWVMYAISDCFLLASKAEGLGLPLLEAMAVGVPCLATNCTAIAELLADGRGSLIEYEYTHIDPFGNANRYWASREDGARKLAQMYETRDVDRTSKARAYAESRTWDIAIEQLNNVIEELK